MRIFKKSPEKELLSEIEELKETVIRAAMSEVVEKVAFKEIDRLAKTSPSSAEYTIGINYIDYLVSLPWNKMTDDNLDIQVRKFWILIIFIKFLTTAIIGHKYLEEIGIYIGEIVLVGLIFFTIIDGLKIECSNNYKNHIENYYKNKT